MYTKGTETASCIDCAVSVNQTLKNPAPICADCLSKRGGKLYKFAVLGDGRTVEAAENQMSIF